MEPKVINIETKLSAMDLFEVFHQEEYCVFLDSSLQKGDEEQYSIIGVYPVHQLQFNNGKCFLNQQQVADNFFQVLDQLLQSESIHNATNLPIIAGCMGFFSYDLGRTLEILPDTTQSIVQVPDGYFLFFDVLIVIEHRNNRVSICALGKTKDQDLLIREVLDKIEHYVGPKKVQYHFDPMEFTSPFSKEGYMEKVEEIRNYIRQGDVYIVNMTHTFVARGNRDPFTTYKYLRDRNPSSFSAVLLTPDFSVLSTSPERFMRIRNRKVTTSPIKGTRRRGITPEEDEALRNELIESEKDRAELLMIVDLERNDLSKVCEPHSVKVTELFKLESYQTVHHLVATVEGKLAEEVTAVDCLKACFPGGSITGAPKVRAMEIIEALEGNRRNLYTGILGYIGFDGDSDFNILIRTLLMKEDKIYLGVGGGITWESDAEKEYEETIDKARVFFESLQWDGKEPEE